MKEDRFWNYLEMQRTASEEKESHFGYEKEIKPGQTESHSDALFGIAAGTNPEGEFVSTSDLREKLGPDDEFPDDTVHKFYLPTNRAAVDSGALTVPDEMMEFYRNSNMTIGGQHPSLKSIGAEDSHATVVKGDETWLDPHCDRCASNVAEGRIESHDRFNHGRPSDPTGKPTAVSDD